MNNFTEGVDFYFNEQCLMVLTATYHLKRGTCCGNVCLHCPYTYENVPEPERTAILKEKKNALINNHEKNNSS